MMRNDLTTDPPETTAPMISPPTPEALDLAALLLRSDKLCAFPTETVYGLGGNALSPSAIARIFETKGRPATNPMIVHVPDVEAARALCTDWPDSAAALAAKFWPGPLTLVLRRGPEIAPNVSGGRDTLAVRVPAHPVALELLRAVGLPLAAPSANRSESLSPTLAEHVERADLPGLELILDGGPCRCGIESTVVDLTTPRPRLLRPGALPVLALRDVLPGLEVPDPDALIGGASPGMMARHYAPNARLILAEDPVKEDPAAYPGVVGALVRAPWQTPNSWEGRPIEVLPNDPAGYAADLYAALHRLDDAGATTVLAQSLPEGEAWAAVRDRLTRASRPKG